MPPLDEVVRAASVHSLEEGRGRRFDMDQEGLAGSPCQQTAQANRTSPRATPASGARRPGTQARHHFPASHQRERAKLERGGANERDSDRTDGHFRVNLTALEQGQAG